MKQVQKNEQLMELLQTLKKAATDNNVAVWKRVAADLEKSTKARRIVNIYKIEKYANNDDVIVVPGKVLGTGELTKKVTVAAFSFSEEARAKIAKKGAALSIPEMVKKNPQGKKIRLMG